MLGWQWLGRVDYADAVARMEALRARILDGDDGAQCLLSSSIPPSSRSAAAPIASTSSRRKRRSRLAASRSAPSSRGGDVTYHGPGQLVAYPVVRLERGVVAHVERLAAAAVAVAASYGVEARFDRACPGVWVGTASSRRSGSTSIAASPSTASRSTSPPRSTPSSSSSPAGCATPA